MSEGLSFTDLTGFVSPHIHIGKDLAIAYVLAFGIGWNRKREGRSAGLRTFPLVAMASFSFIHAAEAHFAGDPEAMARVLTGIITGIGFIGGGAILKGSHKVEGTATAASLWATGAIGAAVALGSYALAVFVTLGTMATLYFSTPLTEVGGRP